MKLESRVALVTGGGTGLGKAVVEMLAREGAKVIVNGVDCVRTVANHYESKNIGGFKAAKALAEELKKSGCEAMAIEADVTSAEQVEKMVEQVIRTFGRLDIVVHVAGVLIQKFVSETSEDDWDSVIDTNLKGTFLVNKSVISQMQKQEFGRIVNFASMAGKNTYASLATYAASKWGILGFTGSLAKEVARDNITINAVCPGIVETSMWKPMSELLSIMGVGETPETAFDNYIATTIPQGVAQTSEDIAEGVLYLLTAPHVTGIALSIDGGVSM